MTCGDTTLNAVMMQLKGFTSDVPESVLKLLWDLEDRGVKILMDKSGQLKARPGTAVAPHELRLLTQYRELIAQIIRWIDRCSERR